MRAEDLKQVVIRTRALEFGDPQLKLGFVLDLPHKFEEGLQSSEFLEALDELFDVPL